MPVYSLASEGNLAITRQILWLIRYFTVFVPVIIQICKHY